MPAPEGPARTMTCARTHPFCPLGDDACGTRWLAGRIRPRGGGLVVHAFGSRRSAALAVPAVLVLSALLGGCSGGSSPGPSAATTSGDTGSRDPTVTVTTGAAAPTPAVPAPFRHPIAGMPAVPDGDVYAATRAPASCAPGSAGDPAYLYVPNSYGAPDHHRHRPAHPQGRAGAAHRDAVAARHAVVGPAHAVRRGERGQPARRSSTRRTGRIEQRIPAVDRPYNLYFTPDGQHAIVMDEEHHEDRRSPTRTRSRRGTVVHRPRLRRPEPRGLLGQRPVLPGHLRVLRRRC